MIKQVKTAIAAAVVATAMVPAASQAATFSGSLDSANDVELFDFTVSGPTFVTLATSALPAFDPVLSLFASDGTLLTFDDDAGPGLEALIGINLNTGLYRFAVTSYANFPAGGNLSNGFTGQSFYPSGGAFTVELTGGAPAGVPEPATWAMLILGFGVVGTALRRRPSVTISYA